MSPKVVVIGDIGWPDYYHLGDEAMTEAAIDMLRERGISDITVIAGDPTVAANFYQCAAVPRLGFWAKSTRATKERKLEEITKSLSDYQLTDREPQDAIDAVAQADAVIIAGGGNLNSQHVQHVYERVALTRIAKHFGKPVFVSSQTVGPRMREQHTDHIREMLDYATCFGARETDTYDFLLGLGGKPGRLVHTMDDAMLLKPRAEDLARVDEVVDAERFIVASFTNYAGTTGMPREAYYEMIAQRLDEAATLYGAPVYLAPHTGSFKGEPTGDRLGHAHVAAASKTGQLISLPLLTARQTIALTQRAELSISTRYHPTVFAPAVGTPAVTVSTQYYSSVRMRGALRNIGTETFVVPSDLWKHDGFIPILSQLRDRSDELSGHLTSVLQTRVSEQTTWWDQIACVIKQEGHWESLPNLSDVPQFELNEAWAALWTRTIRLEDAVGIEKFEHSWTKRDLKRFTQALESSREKHVKAREELKEAKRELAKHDAQENAYAHSRLVRSAVRVSAWARRVRGKLGRLFKR